MYPEQETQSLSATKPKSLLKSVKFPFMRFSAQCKISAVTSIQLVTLLVLTACAILSSGCSTTHYQRMIYDALRQQDCIVNQLDSFCARTFALDFYDYTALRNDYMRSLNDQPFTQVTDNGEDQPDIMAVVLKQDKLY